ncbi:agmatine deiminase family protein [Candidatus Berkiella aquae]|uniref:Agmatine deiminase n=1 Tax=Candidatus Berkiella aquae TaxID=295108 RepID=A0A0Q9YPU8_9GAMM|nr:agmatine deiminase family protein [Candidatus Berkiella aquae]MCS5711803.1 agmatine deiminase family protein [Candidatus Berkiella aquae]
MNNTRLPAEWEKQHAILLTWPHEHGAWGKDYHDSIEPVFIEITRAVVATQTIIIGAFDATHQNHIHTVLTASGIQLAEVKTYIVPSDDVWARDHGPITVYQGDKSVLCDFQFTGWGEKYAYQLDDQIPSKLVASGLLSNYGYQAIPFILEGGAIDCDGQGTLLTTEQCLRTQARHADLTREDIEASLATYLGIKRVLWLSDGQLAGDDTDGHVDTLARFFDANTIAYASTDDENDPHFASLKAMERTLQSFKNNVGEPYQLVKLPLPSAIYDASGKRLPATYANFLFCDQQVLVPIYQDPKDEQILATFKAHFPDRKIVGIDCCHAIEQYGSLHCLTMQIPAFSQR